MSIRKLVSKKNDSVLFYNLCIVCNTKVSQIQQINNFTLRSEKLFVYFLSSLTYCSLYCFYIGEQKYWEMYEAENDFVYRVIGLSRY